MRLPRVALSLLGAAAMTAPFAADALAQNEQFFPALVYRTGAYAPNGMPFANGYADYLKLVNARDGGINGVKLTFEECETGYATDRGVECYERLKGKGPTGAAAFSRCRPASPSRSPRRRRRQDPAAHHGLRPRRLGRRPRLRAGTSRCSARYWDAADILIQHVAKKDGGVDKLKGKKIALVYHDSPYGKEPIALLEERAKMHGYELRCAAGDASRRRAEGDLAADPPAAARLRVPVGLGRDELDRDQGSGRRRLPARARCTACGGPAPSPT